MTYSIPNADLRNGIIGDRKSEWKDRNTSFLIKQLIPCYIKYNYFKHL
jgi:hypothetical protein